MLAQRHLVENYTIIDQIGQGSFAVVWKAVRHPDGRPVAIKEIAMKKLSPQLRDSVLFEIGLLERTNHPNIVRLLDTFEADDRTYLVLEYCEGGDLARYIKRHGRVTESVARKFMQHLGGGLHVLHSSNLIHRDLKPENLLLSTCDSNAILKIADFGLARHLGPQGYVDCVCGSPLYMAPEVLQCQKYDTKADLWSVGAILFELLTGEPPFHGKNHVQLLRNMKSSNGLQFPVTVAADVHPDCLDLCKRLLCINPVDRIIFDDFFNHKFMRPVRVKQEHSRNECLQCSGTLVKGVWLPWMQHSGLKTN